jgi:ribokinase
VIADPEKGTGLAVISVDDAAENAIIVISGANMALDDSDVERCIVALDAGAKVLLLQHEVPLPASMKAAQAARDRGVTVLWDPAPARALPREAFALASIMTPNELETEALVGFKPVTFEDAAQAAVMLRGQGVETVVIKLGAQGAFWLGPEGEGRVDAFKVNAIDTVAAGDAFNGALAVALAEGRPLDEALRWGAAAGALATTKKGASSAMPYRHELESLLRT